MKMENNKFQEDLKNVIKKLSEVFKKENSENEIAKFVVDDLYKNDLHYLFRNFELNIFFQIISRIQEKIVDFDYSYNLIEILLTGNLKGILENEIIKHNKTSACCADESRTIIYNLIEFMKTGEHKSLQITYSEYWNRIKDEEEKERLKEWENEKNLTYWSCKKWKDTEEVLEWLIKNVFNK